MDNRPLSDMGMDIARKCCRNGRVNGVFMIVYYCLFKFVIFYVIFGYDHCMHSCCRCRLVIEIFIKYKNVVFITMSSVVISADFIGNELMKLSENEIVVSDGS